MFAFLFFSACSLPHNPLFINCKNSSAITKENGISKNGFFVQQDLHGLTIDDLEIEKRHRGISIRPKDALKVNNNKNVDI